MDITIKEETNKQKMNNSINEKFKNHKTDSSDNVKYYSNDNGKISYCDENKQQSLNLNSKQFHKKNAENGKPTKNILSNIFNKNNFKILF